MGDDGTTISGSRWHPGRDSRVRHQRPCEPPWLLSLMQPIFKYPNHQADIGRLTRRYAEIYIIVTTICDSTIHHRDSTIRALFGSYFDEKNLLTTPLRTWYLEHGFVSIKSWNMSWRYVFDISVKPCPQHNPMATPIQSRDYHETTRQLCIWQFCFIERPFYRSSLFIDQPINGWMRTTSASRLLTAHAEHAQCIISATAPNSFRIQVNTFQYVV